MTMRGLAVLALGWMIVAASALPGALAQTPGDARLRSLTVNPQVFNAAGPARDLVPSAPGASSASPSVVGGEPAISATMPFHLVVAIRYRSGVGSGRSLCSGTVLDHLYVLTAGHCGCGLRGSYEVMLGDDLAAPTDVVPVFEAPILIDPLACRSADTLRDADDLALLRLSRPVGYKTAGCDQPLGPASGAGRLDCRLYAPRETDEQDLIAPRPVLYSDFDGWSLRSKLPRGVGLYVVGFGRTLQGLPNARLYGIVPLLTATCEERRFRRICKPFAEMILADQRGAGARRTDTCDGDSGGPVFAPHTKGVALIGVTSRPAPFAHDDAVHHCGGGGVYTMIGTHSVYSWLASYLAPDRVPPLSTVRVAGPAATP